ncbi:hypothetical protein FB45DRAFT_899007 [Roridomyces roridus]|uniref:DUF6534 domain-containing protein n=1 Tax=Roridomyces roridus TaxID=1738132 RepID=A0AAD7CCK7_9AGAR|nr:hypothetical protein FB45DRAFT_899007 [Roridomyces roridus]
MATLDNTIGCLFDAVVVSAALYGTGCLQAWYYFRSYAKRDPWYIQALVAFVTVCDTAQQAILTACAYTYIVTNFGNPAILDVVVNTLIIEIFFSNFISVAVQLFYCYRVYRLSNRNLIPTTFLSVLSIGSFISLFVYTVKALKITTFAELTTLKTLSMSCNIIAAVTDVLISVVLVYYLYISKTGMTKTDDMINRLIAFTFNTGMPTSLCAIAACVGINVSPETFIYIFFFLLQGRFYTNTLLVTLNTRDYIRSVVAPGSVQEFRLENAGGSGRDRSGGGMMVPQPNHHESGIAIRIERMRVQHGDEDFETKHDPARESRSESTNKMMEDV